MSPGCSEDNQAEFDNVGMKFTTEDGLVVSGCCRHHDVVVVNTCDDCEFVMCVCAVSRLCLLGSVRVVNRNILGSVNTGERV